MAKIKSIFVYSKRSPSIYAAIERVPTDSAPTAPPKIETNILITINKGKVIIHAIILGRIK